VRINWRLGAPLAVVMFAAACGTGTATAQAHPNGSARAAAATTRSSPAASHPAGPASSHPASAGSATSAPAGAQDSAAGRPLAGKTIGIDPGHNGRNKDDPTYINHQIWNGREWEACDTTGTETDGGYTEARFNFNVATYLRADLRKLGARVVFTRQNNNGVGPCVNRRARILNRAHSNVAIDIHADGGPASGRGFTVLEPVADGPNNHAIKSSIRFGGNVRSALLKYTRMPESDYYGHDGVILRNDLAGLNLATQPKILIETGNMRNATDARLLVTTWFQKRLALALTHAILRFLTGRWGHV
jgi:N-acetylmuramoyl-L-alanine amidase